MCKVILSYCECCKSLAVYMYCFQVPRYVAKMNYD